MEKKGHFQQSKGFQVINSWLQAQQRHPFVFQEAAWQHIAENDSGLVNAPTGCGKTFAVFLGAIIQYINEFPDSYKNKQSIGLRLIWITPLRALAKDIGRAMEEANAALQIPWKVAIRNGDTPINERQKQKKQPPEVLIITPESLHLVLAQKDHHQLLANTKIIAIDEWHELLGSKRGVQVELAIAHIVAIQQKLARKPQVWGISATIGNLEEAAEVLLHSLNQQPVIIKAAIQKPVEIHSIIPDEIERYPWAGHLGIKLVQKIIPIIEQSTTTLIFINTRGMSERWYQAILEEAPELAGAIALHHGSIEPALRIWVEEALHTHILKAVVCTASLDLGVDFRPVDTVIQVGSPKGIARFLQRAGRSGHSPGEISKIYFLPTHSLELVEAAALKKAAEKAEMESKLPLQLCFDVLIQYACTLAVGGGFNAHELWEEVTKTYCFADMQPAEWQQVLLHITNGGAALQEYHEYQKVVVDNNVYSIKNKAIALRHRTNIGTIVSDAMLKVQLMNSGYIGSIEEWFISKLSPGDSFVIAGRNVELVRMKDMTVTVRKSNATKTIVPSWMGGRMSLTANLGAILRDTFQMANDVLLNEKNLPPEMLALQPLFDLQKQLSIIPTSGQLLIEHIEDKAGYHLMVYPFEGRQVHEAMSALLAYRLSQQYPITFSISMNDYGFELLSDQPIPVDDANVYDLFSTKHLFDDILKSINKVEMAARKFRDIAVIGGLIFQGLPGEKKKARHLQSSASLLFKVFNEYDSNNILLNQAYKEVLAEQMEEIRLRNAMKRILESDIKIMFPAKYTPLSFPIIVDGLNRNNLSSEKLEDRIKKMQIQAQR